MLGIKLGSGWMDMDPATQIQLRMISPAFARVLEDNSHSLSFSLPGTDHNLRLAGYYDAPIVRNVVTTFDAWLYFDHIGILSGEIDFQAATGPERRLTCRFRFGISTVAQTLKNTLIRDVDLGGVRNIAGVLGNTEVELSISQLVVGGMAYIVVNGSHFYYPWSSGMDEEAILSEIRDIINAAGIGVTATVLGVGAAATLQLVTIPPDSINIDINPSGNQQQWTIEDESGAAVAIHDAMIDHMNAVAGADPGDYDYTFVPVRNFIFYDNLNADFKGYVNLWDWDTQTFVKNSSSAGEQWQNTAVPFPRAAYLLARGLAHIGYTDVSTFTSLPEFQKIYFWNNQSLDQVRNDGVGDFNGFKSFIDLKDHVPVNLSLADLIIWMRDNFNLIIDVNPGKREINFYQINDLPGAAEKDWREKTTNVYQITRPGSSEKGIHLSFAEDGNDVLNESGYHAVQFPDYKTFGGKDKIESAITPMAVFAGLGHPLSAGTWMVPAIEQVGRTSFPDVEGVEYTIRSFKFQGLQPGSSALDYPLGTHGNTDQAGTQVGDWGLVWDDSSSIVDRGLVDEFWEPLLSQTEEEVEIEQAFILDLRDILGLDFIRPYRIRTEAGDIRVLVKQLNLTIGMNGVTSSVATMLRL